MQINNTFISPGTNALVNLNIARLPAGTVIDTRVHVYRSATPGPVMLVMGGLHGDEINGVEILRRSIEYAMFTQLQQGSVIAIPLLNVYGFINFSRDAVEGKDVNRSFPGSHKGSLASRVAQTLTKEILPLVDFGIDFHTGGSTRYNFPQIRYSAGDDQAKTLAQQFAAPFLMQKSSPEKSLRHTAREMGVPMLVYEGGESLRYDGFSIEHGLEGIQRILFAQGMSATEKPANRTPKWFTTFKWVRAEKAGLFTWTQESGAKVVKGETLGVIHNLYGEPMIKVKASMDGYIVGHNNAPVVNAGDALFHIGK